MTYDQRCYDLAALFLGDVPAIHTKAHIDALASEIQRTIEYYIEYELDCAENGRPVPQHGSGP